jgi:foldase protein PrsA
VSPNRGKRRPTSGKGKAGGKGPLRSPSAREAAHRLGLLIFGSTLLILFVVLAIAEGIGQPSIPSGDVILVENVPGDGGNISKAEFDHALELAATQGQLKEAPKPGTPKYEELKEGALTSLIEAAWLEGQGAEMGVEPDDQEIAKEFKKIKKETFPKPSEFKKFIKESGFTSEDIDERVKLQIVKTEIEKQLMESEPKPSDSEIENYYEAAKATQYTQPASRDIRVIVNKDKAKVEAAQQKLAKDSSEASWKKVAKEYSTDTQSKNNGGLRPALTEAAAEEPLKAKAFAAPQGQLEGPLKGPQGFYLFEVVKLTPEQAQPLDQVKSTISTQLAEQMKSQEFARFVAGFGSRWHARTFCASGYVFERCANFKANGHSQEASPACYEANPKEGLPEGGCPAPVPQLKPALPGSVNPVAPEGQRLSQRPQPANLEAEAAGLEGIPGATGVPPTAP